MAKKKAKKDVRDLVNLLDDLHDRREAYRAAVDLLQKAIDDTTKVMEETKTDLDALRVPVNSVPLSGTSGRNLSKNVVGKKPKGKTGVIHRGSKGVT